MSNTNKIWKSQNYFFDDIIKEYIKEHPELNLSEALWYRDSMDLEYFDVDYYSKRRSKKCRVTSQLTNIQMLSNKQLQYKGLVDFKGGDCPDYLPETFSFTNTKESIENLKEHFNNSRQWIIKPVGGSFRNGVQVVKTWDALHQAVTKSRFPNWVLQRFISPPALCNGRKFHFRVYVLVVKTAKGLDLYIYRKGIMYFAKQPYQLTQTKPNHDHAESLLSGGLSTENSFVFPDKFAKCFNQNLFDYNIFPQMCNIVQDTIMSVHQQLQCPNRNRPDYCCFKLLGYDILCDSNFQLYLGEINARRITFKYPPEWMKRQLYFNLLDIVLRNHNDEKNDFYHLQNYPIMENFQVKKQTRKDSSIIKYLTPTHTYQWIGRVVITFLVLLVLYKIVVELVSY